MILKSIKASLVPNRVNLKFDNGSYLPLLVDDVVNFHLHSELDLNPSDYSRLQQASAHYLLLNYSLSQIALSAKITSELRLKLKLKFRQYSLKYDYSGLSGDETISLVIAKLESDGLLSEKDYVQSVISRYRNKPLRYLTQYLQSKGINPQNYHDLLLVRDDREILRKVLKTSKYENIREADFATKKKLIASLLRKGFAYDDIKTLIDIEGEF